MSTFVDMAINPKTGKPQPALFIDDHYGSHRYGVGFRIDGTEPSIFKNIVTTEYVIYTLEQITTVKPDKQHEKL